MFLLLNKLKETVKERKNKTQVLVNKLKSKSKKAESHLATYGV